MRVLVDGIPKSKGGIGSLLINFARLNADAQEPLQFDYLVPEESDYQHELEMLGSECFVVPSITSVLSYRKAIISVFKKHHYDYLWMNNTSKVNRFLPLYAKRNGTKIITHPHGVSGEEKGIKALIFQLLNLINYDAYMRVMDIPFTCSVRAAQVYYHNPDVERKAIIINNGIRTEQYKFSPEARARIRAALSVGEDQIVLGTVGRLSAVKNQSFLISLLTCLPPKYCCVVLGSGEDREKLLHMSQEAGVADRFLMPGEVDRVYEYLCAFDVFLLPSLHEGMPFAMIEAQASGLPCIVSHTVSREVQLTELVQFGMLNDLVDWKEKICGLKLYDMPRVKFADLIKGKGYSVEESYSTFVQQLLAYQ